MVRAEKMPKMDSTLTGGKCDPYIQFKLGGMVIETIHVKNELNPQYNQVILIPLTEPSLYDKLWITLWDDDGLSAHDIIGSNIMKKKAILAGEHKHYHWLNFYGANINGNTEHCDLMNGSAALGTWWKGRVYLKVEAVECNNPKLATENLPDKTIAFMNKYSD